MILMKAAALWLGFFSASLFLGSIGTTPSSNFFFCPLEICADRHLQNISNKNPGTPHFHIFHPYLSFKLFNRKHPKKRSYQTNMVICYMGVSVNGGTPSSHPKMIIFSRKIHGNCWGNPPFLATFIWTHHLPALNLYQKTWHLSNSNFCR